MIARAAMLLLSTPVICSGALSRTPNCLQPGTKQFVIYDATLFSGKPEMRQFGIRPAYIVDRGFWKDEAQRREVDYEKLPGRLNELPAADGLIALDVEHLPLTGDDKTVAASLETMRKLADASRKYGSGRKVGYYGLLPLSEYWRPINGLPGGGFSDWKRDNARIGSLDRSVDVNLPSLYTYYPDRPGWVRQAKALVCAARQVSRKPVYAFIWPEYHDSTALAGRALPADYWRLQLQTLQRIADGVVIWGGYDLKNGRAYRWNPEAEWWNVTRQQLKLPNADTGRQYPARPTP